MIAIETSGAQAEWLGETLQIQGEEIWVSGGSGDMTVRLVRGTEAEIETLMPLFEACDLEVVLRRPILIETVAQTRADFEDDYADCLEDGEGDGDD